ncbi:hypothetical protein CQW23_27105 [Capsicum baccatum]|uniref:Leucine-rich repeat-containing N-terminal plant-type domain-containing protein n=1 Tax=Capsicum baccatum TaxID=33114 RepID=A0A2G2VQQ4_CAPBA|nr:hypothetical protein CQW23_27105 [Capsicum baccatum]
MGYDHLLFLLASFFLCQLVFSSLTCSRDQTLALVEFNQSFVVEASYSCDEQSYPKTSSWNMSRDCGLWDGVICDEMSGHVIELDLGCSSLAGTIDSNSSLFQLSHIKRLNLSYNNLYSSKISPKFGRFSNLTHLDLSGSSLSSQIPYEISHLSKLQSLFLSGNSELRVLPRDFKMLLQNLTQLRELDLSHVNIFSTISLNFSSHLTTLMLEQLELHGMIPESIFQRPNLEELYLDLHSCNLSGQIPKSLWNLTRIETLGLGDNQLEGPIFHLFTEGLQNLNTLRLSNNSLDGAIPSSVFSLPSLSVLDLKNNHFSGQLSDFRYNSALVYIDIINSEPCEPSLACFRTQAVASVDLSNFKQLTSLDLSYNSISLTNDNKVEPYSLRELMLSACEVTELDILRSAKNLFSLDLSHNKIQGRIPDWALSNWMQLHYLNLSHNMLTSIDLLPFLPINTIDLRSNFLQGTLPDVLPLSLELFFMSNDNLTGEIPSSVCNLTSLRVLDLARNNLKGAIPQCLGNMNDQLVVLDMQHNSLSWNLQTTFSSGSQLKSFNLHGNNLEGKIPTSLANCKQLEVLDLGNNNLNDAFLCAELPTSLFHNLKSMKRIDDTMAQRDYQDSVTVVTKGMELEVVRILSLYATMDLSSNKFEGHIPSVLGDLIALRVLNLSHNVL